MTWQPVTIAGAFVLGITLGAFAAIRLAGYILDYLRDRTEPPDTPDLP